MAFPHIMVISLNEIPNDVEIRTEGVVTLQMIIKKYLVSNMNEALTRIRYELGKDAIIVSQRKVRKPGFKGLFSEKQIEVTAAVENSSKGTEENFQSSINDIRKIMEQEIIMS